jgi:alpha-beta hydrolase superfamily lysophospholipase
MLLIHGLGEHSGRWEHVGGFFADRGIDVTSFDLRGHGRSEGDRVHLESFEQYLDDAEQVFAGVPADVPRVIYGHSMGGLIATSYAVSDRPQPDLYVLSAPAIDPTVPLYIRVVSNVLGRVTPNLRIPNSIKGEQLSRDPAVGEKYFADPLVETKATAQFGLAFLSQIGWIGSQLERLRTPALVVHGADDPLVAPQGSAPLAAIPGVERKLFPGLRHEIHNEPEQKDVLGFIGSWLDAQLG